MKPSHARYTTQLATWLLLGLMCVMTGIEVMEFDRALDVPAVGALILLVSAISPLGQARPVLRWLALPSAALLIIYAAPTTSTAVPAACIALYILHGRVPPTRRVSLLAIYVGLWLISMGVANGFRDIWTSGAGYALATSSGSESLLQSLLIPDQLLQHLDAAPEIFEGPYRTETVWYRSLVLLSVLGPIAIGCLLWIGKTRRFAACAAAVLLVIAGLHGWDPALTIVFTCVCLLLAIHPTATPISTPRTDRITWSRTERTLALIVGITIFIWPHLQRYLATEFNVAADAYFAQNDHGHVQWSPTTTLSITTEDGQYRAIAHGQVPALEDTIKKFRNRVRIKGEFASRQPLATAIQSEFPNAQKLQISTSRYLLDPRHQRISQRGLDIIYKQRSDGSYLRSKYWRNRRFYVDQRYDHKVPDIYPVPEFMQQSTP